MTTTSMQRRGGGGSYVQRSNSSGLYDVLDLILDKGLVIDIFVRVSLIGIEILTIDARIVVASVDTYLRFAEAVNRLDLQPQEQVAGLPGLMREVTEGGARSKTKGALSGAKETAQDVIGSLTGRDRDDDGDGSGDGDRRRDDRSAPATRRAKQRG